MCTSIGLVAFLTVSFVLFALPATIFVSSSEVKLALGNIKVEEFQCSRLLTRMLIINILKHKHNIELGRNDLNRFLQMRTAASSGVIDVVKRVVWGMAAYVVSGTCLVYSFWTTEAADQVALYCA